MAAFNIGKQTAGRRIINVGDDIVVGTTIIDSDREHLTAEIVAVANATRKTNLSASHKLDKSLTKHIDEELIMFICMFMAGLPKDEIIDILDMLPNTVKKLDKYNLAW